MALTESTRNPRFTSHECALMRSGILDYIALLEPLCDECMVHGAYGAAHGIRERIVIARRLRRKFEARDERPPP